MNYSTRSRPPFDMHYLWTRAKSRPGRCAPDGGTSLICGGLTTRGPFQDAGHGSSIFRQPELRIGDVSVMRLYNIMRIRGVGISMIFNWINVCVWIRSSMWKGLRMDCVFLGVLKASEEALWPSHEPCGRQPVNMRHSANIVPRIVFMIVLNSCTCRNMSKFANNRMVY